MDPNSADPLLETLLALSIHSLVVDTVAQGHPFTPTVIDRLHLTDIENAATVRPHHELLAGLPRLGERDQHRVDAVKILIYDDASALHMGRLSQMVRGTLLQLKAGLSVDNPTCQDVAD